MDNELDEFLDYVDILEEELERVHRMPKRYIRDVANPMEFFEDRLFEKRYRFPKVIVRDIIMPLVAVEPPVSNRGLPIPRLLQLLITLRFYATGSFQIVHGDLRGISQPSVSRIIKNISVCLAEKTRDFVKFPVTEADQRRNVERFHRMYNFPAVSGCIDCTHIPIKNPGSDAAEVYRNRKHYFSLNVQVVAGPQMEILDLVARHPGSAHDNTIFERSYVCMRFQEQTIMGLLLGDNGYACRSYILTPLINPQTPAENNYNRSHISTRNIVERVFGVWKRIFPCLRRVLATNLRTSVAVICATAVLYNICVKHKLQFNIDEPPDQEDNEDIQVQNNDNHGLAFRRNFIASHFA